MHAISLYSNINKNAKLSFKEEILRDTSQGTRVCLRSLLICNLHELSFAPWDSPSWKLQTYEQTSCGSEVREKEKGREGRKRKVITQVYLFAGISTRTIIQQQT